MAKHFELQITDGEFSYAPKTDQIAAEAALDGLYVIRTTCTPTQLGAPAVARAYKQLKVNEQAFRTMKDTIEIRPIHHHLESRVRAHVFLCMLACHVPYELDARLAPLLFTDTTPTAPVDPVAPAQRSSAAKTKAGSQTTPDGHPAMNRGDLLAELATICRNQIRIGANEHTYPRLTTPTTHQQRALQLLVIKLHT